MSRIIVVLAHKSISLIRTLYSDSKPTSYHCITLNTVCMAEKTVTTNFIIWCDLARDGTLDLPYLRRVHWDQRDDSHWLWSSVSIRFCGHHDDLISCYDVFVSTWQPSFFSGLELQYIMWITGVFIQNEDDWTVCSTYLFYCVFLGHWFLLRRFLMCVCVCVCVYVLF